MNSLTGRCSDETSNSACVAYGGRRCASSWRKTWRSSRLPSASIIPRGISRRGRINPKRAGLLTLSVTTMPMIVRTPICDLHSSSNSRVGWSIRGRSHLTILQRLKLLTQTYAAKTTAPPSQTKGSTSAISKDALCKSVSASRCTCGVAVVA